MTEETKYPYQVRFAEEGPTLQKQIEMLLRDRMKEVSAEWTTQR